MARAETQILVEDQFGISHVGKVRTSNQDAILVDPAKSIYLLADGMGGHRGGEIAAAITLDILHQELRRLAPEMDYVQGIQAAYQKASDGLREKTLSDPSLKGMGTTALCALWQKETLHLGHVGDSRVYLLTAQGTLFQLTRDHSLVQDAEIDSDSSTGQMLRNILTRSVGHSDPLTVDTLSYQPVHSGKILLCSDGLHGMMDNAILKHTLNVPRSCRQVCQELVDTANDAGGHDNVSVIVVQFTVIH
jgi:protein phosphatase